MSNTSSVWIDTDTAIGVPGADVDDGLALIQAFHSPELQVRGISSVYGNAPLSDTDRLAREVSARFGHRDLGVARGAANAQELGEESDAVSLLAQALEEAPLHVVAIGPLTNIGSLILRRPELCDRMESIVMVAARRPGQRFLSHPEQPSPFPDLNFDCDPAAMQVLLDSEVRLVFAPWEVSSHVWIDEADLDRIAEGSESGAYIAEHARPWLAIWRRNLKAPGFNPFDTLAIAWLTHPHLLQHFEGGAWIEPGPDDTASPEEQARGKQKPHLLVDAQRGGRRAIYCHEPLSEFKALLLERLVGSPDR